MINSIVKTFTGKQIVLLNPHRNSKPLLNTENKREFVFINPSKLWQATSLIGRKSVRRYALMNCFINIISPEYIVDINWITRLHTLYKVWCKKNNKKFVVVQHGTYGAGIITDIPHRIIKCDIFLSWSAHFKLLLEQYNKGKKLDIRVWGNTVYNQYNRDSYTYIDAPGNKVLLAPSLVVGERLEGYKRLAKQLTELGFEVYIKEHAFQRSKSFSIEGYPIITGDIFPLLQKKEYGIIITDVSSTMNDIIFFKTRAIYFSPPGEYDFYVKNVYAEYLNNLFFEFHQLTSKDFLYNFINITAQEKLLNCLVWTGKNDNSLKKLKTCN